MNLILLKIMIKEEWRLHTSLFEKRMFASFPLLIGIISFIASFFLPFFAQVMAYPQIFQSAHYIFIFFGVSIGAFGLFGREVMNRRFGQASLLAYSSRSLPISERTIFTNFFIKDILFYILLWILPITLGFTLATPFIQINTLSAIIACSTLMLSFLIGLSIVFFLSTLYAHSNKILIILLIIATLLVIYLTKFQSIPIKSLLIPYSLYYNPSINKIIILLLLISIPSTLSLAFIKVDYPERKKQYNNKLTDLTKKLKFSAYAHYIAKDFLDLKRSEGGLGKIIFSFLFPIGLTWLFLYIFLELIPTVKAIMIFAIFLGIVSSSIYNMLTAFDTFNPYMFLPVKVSMIIKSKIISYALINTLSLVILILVSISLISILNPYIMVISPIVVFPALYVLTLSYKKWDKWSPLSI